MTTEPVAGLGHSELRELRKPVLPRVASAVAQGFPRQRRQSRVRHRSAFACAPELGRVAHPTRGSHRLGSRGAVSALAATPAEPRPSRRQEGQPGSPAVPAVQRAEPLRWPSPLEKPSVRGDTPAGCRLEKTAPRPVRVAASTVDRAPGRVPRAPPPCPHPPAVDALKERPLSRSGHWHHGDLPPNHFPPSSNRTARHHRRGAGSGPVTARTPGGPGPGCRTRCNTPTGRRACRGRRRRRRGRRSRRRVRSRGWPR
jgi:hypothetical protein